VAIDRVGDRATLDIWSQVLCDGFGAPRSFGEAFSEMAEAIGLDGDSPFRHYLARIDGRPVGTCSLFLGAGVGGIYDVSTLPGHRRAGIGAAITRRAMRDARDGGYRMAILHASQQGLGMYRSLGFETICDIGQHVWAPENLTR
jgi:GNAT superfamily N-acetyltransferase